MRVVWLAVFAVVAVVAAALTTSIERGPDFHRYADARTWLGIPHAGDVLSNAGFVLAALWASARVVVPYGRAVCAGVLWIGVGSAIYHVAPGDLLLALDWAPIAVTLALLATAVIHDRAGRRAGRIAVAVGPVLALSAVLWWLATGGTHGGNMAPYVAVQAAGIALPPVAALLAPGAVATRWLLLGVAGFLAARVLGVFDRTLLDAIGISGHSLKHLAAAGAAACALRALMRR